MEKSNSVYKVLGRLFFNRNWWVGIFFTLIAVCFIQKAQAQGGQCNQITFSFEHYEPCHFRAKYQNASDCYTEIRYSLASGSFASWDVNTAAGFTVEVISGSELWIHHMNGFLPLGDQVPLLFTLPPDLNTTMGVSWNDDCFQVGCDIFGGIPIESCPDPKDAKIIGVKYKECGNLPYIDQTPLSGWTIQLLDDAGNMINEQVTNVDGSYAFYDLPHGTYVVREAAQPGWTPKVPASGQVTIDLDPSQERITNFGNCPPPQPPCDCPAGTLPGGNVVINGNFSGSGGFSTGYTLKNTPSLQPGQYWIGSNPSAINAGFAACGDHTTGSGNMMVVNGAPNQNTTIWSQTFTMAPNSTYKFEAWVASLSSASPAQLSVFFNFGNVGYEPQRVFAPVTTCSWERICVAWPNGPNVNTVTISLVNQNAATTGNDFAIDDISFRKCAPPSGIFSGLVYQTCDSMSYTNQPLLSGWTVQLLDSMLNIISEQVTDTSGGYAFNDLTAGNYFVKTLAQPGWTPTFPTSGQVAINLGAGQDVVQNFGVCPGCSGCPTPTNFTVSPVSANEVEVSWDPIPIGCGGSVCVCDFWEDGSGLLHYKCFYYVNLPPDEPHLPPLFPLEPFVTNHLYAMTRCDSSMSAPTDTIPFYYPCFGGFTNCQGNLLTNGGFEGPGSAGLPNAADQIGLCPGWQSATNGSGVNSVGDWYTDAASVSGFWPGYYNDFPNQQYTFLHASCGYRYAGFDLNSCEGISTQLSAPIGVNNGYNIGFWWSPKEPVTANFTFLAILSAGPCTMNSPNGGTVCGHQCGGDFHIPITVTSANKPGVWYFHSFTANAPMTVNHLTFTANSSGQKVNNYIYVDEVCVQKVYQICFVDKPRITHHADQPNAFYGEADLGAGSTLLSAVWNFGDGSQDSSCCLGSVIHDFAPGTYEVCLTVTAIDTSGIPCSNSTCISVDITTQSTKCDHVASFIYPAYIGDCCFSLNTNNIEPNCFTQLDLNLSSGTFVNAQFGSNWNVAIIGNTASLTPIGGGFIPVGQDIPMTICDPMGVDPYALDIDFIYTGAVCHRTIDFSCGANCTCLGFTNLQFTALQVQPIPPVPVDCENVTPVILPCVANDVLYNFEGNFGCSNECPSSVQYHFFDQSHNLVKYGLANYDSGLDEFNLNPGFKFIPGTYQLVLTGLCGTNDTCYCSINFTIPDCPCCSVDINEFNQTIAYEISITKDPTNCKAMLNIGNLPCQRVDWVDWGDFTVDQGPFLSGTMPMHSYAQSGTYTITYSVTEFNAITGLNCFQKTVTETIQIDCNCACGIFDLEIRLGGALNQPVVCGQTVNLGLNQGFAFYPKFQCQGNYCPPTAPVDWTLTGPGTNVSGTETTTPGIVFTILPVNPGQFTTPGLYTLTITGHCDQNLCPCVITFNVQDPCCTDQAAFIAAAAAVNTFGTLGNCNLSFQAVGLNDCMRISYDWGDNTSSGPFADNFLTTHSYSATGTYNVCHTIEEVDFFGNVCWKYDSCEDVSVICDTCVCGSFSDEQFYNSSWPGVTANVTCNQQTTYLLPCTYPDPGQLFIFHGNMTCSAFGCLGDSVQWSLVEMNSGNSIGSGTAKLNPWVSGSPTAHYDLYLNPAWFTPGVSYMLTVTGHCGINVCTCKVTFSFRSCLCTCDKLAAHVGKGFAVTGNKTSCVRKFRPIALCPNDMVTWIITGPNGFNLTTTSIGNANIMVTFNAPGLYYVCMVVKRTDANGLQCTQEYCRNVIVQCKAEPTDPVVTLTACPGGDRLKNGSFTEGLVEGELGQGGAVENWQLFSNTGNGYAVVENDGGASDDGYVVLTGSKGNFAGIYQEVNVAGDTVYIGFSARRFYPTIPDSLDCSPLPCLTMEIRLESGLSGDPTPQVIYSQMFDPSFVSWKNVSIAVPIALDPTKHILVVCLQSEIETSSRSISVDNIEFCTNRMVGTVQPTASGRIRIFPNPNAGDFRVVLPEVASTGLSFRITDLAGRFVQEQVAEPGVKEQDIQAGLLPNGLYFFELISEGRVLAVEKFVKQ